jgi:RNA polymerase sigma-70 factor (family 1)
VIFTSSKFGRGKPDKIMENNREAALIEGFNLGDPEAFNEIYELHHRSLYFFVRKLIGDDAEAQDIVSETFRKLWQRKLYFSSLVNIKAFLYITARNNGFDYLRFTKRQKESQKELAEHTDPNEDFVINKIVESELLEEIYNEIKNLPDRTRDIFRMHYEDGLPLKEISEKLNITQEVVRVTKFRALQDLRKFAFSKRLLQTLLAIYLFFA